MSHHLCGVWKSPNYSKQYAASLNAIYMNHGTTVCAGQKSLWLISLAEWQLTGIRAVKCRGGFKQLKLRCHGRLSQKLINQAHLSQNTMLNQQTVNEDEAILTVTVKFSSVAFTQLKLSSTKSTEMEEEASVLPRNNQTRTGWEKKNYQYP